jgi:hypothetical protein
MPTRCAHPQLAADIFEGRFSAKFVQAAKLAADLLTPHSLYARYYGLTAAFEQVCSLEAPLLLAGACASWVCALLLAVVYSSRLRTLRSSRVLAR